MRFGAPLFAYLFLLIPLLGLFYWYAHSKKKRALKKFATAEILNRLLTSVSPWRRVIKSILMLLVFFFCILALIRPQYGTKMELMKRRGLDVVVAVDVSLSMMAQDLKPNRLSRAKYEINRFIDALGGDRIGLVAFAGDAFLQCPLTLDYSAAKIFLDILNPNLVGTPGTSLSEAIRVSLSAFDPKDRRYRVIVLLTDGEDHSGDVEKWAEEAANQGVIIFTVGIGSLQGIPIPVKDGSGNVSYKKDRNGNIVTTQLDINTLQKLALRTQGAFYHATPGAFELQKVLDKINEMEKRELEAERFIQYEERFQIPLIIALILFVIESLLSERRKIKGIWKGRFNS